MAGRIRDEDIALVRERSGIGEVVGEYLQLRGVAGGSMKGLCPFHDEKTPSFHVTPARGLWYCFSCTQGGDVIKFVQKIDNLGFTEAVERLANRVGIELRYEQGGHIPGQEQSQRRRLIEEHRAAAERSAYDQHDPIVNVERQALKLAIQRPALCGPAFDELPSTVFTVPAHAAVCELIAANGGVASARSAREWAERLRAAAPSDNARGFVTRLAVESLEVPGATGEPDARFAEAVLARVEELSVSRPERGRRPGATS